MPLLAPSNNSFKMNKVIRPKSRALAFSKRVGQTDRQTDRQTNRQTDKFSK